MSPIARIRIRWKDQHQHVPAAGLAQPLSASAGTLGQRLWALAPWNWRVRFKWVGFGAQNSALPGMMGTTSTSKSVHLERPVRPLRTFDLPNMKVRVGWIGFPSRNYRGIGVLGLLALCVWLGLFAVTQPAGVNNTSSTIEMEKVDTADFVFYEANLGGKVIRMMHSQLDIGQSQDIFDNDTKTLIRGREDNPFILEFEFAQPQPVSGLVMDFGGMDFDLRVQVYDAEGGKPISYNGEYRQQPPEPHVEMDFINGPAVVSRIYIEIEQFNPPDEPHIHVREVLFKE